MYVMNLVIAAATQPEIQPSIDFLQQRQYSVNNNQYHILITGVGSLISTYHLTRYLTTHKPDCCIQAGVGGSFTPDFPPGKLVLIKEEAMGDTGAMQDENFYDVFDLGLARHDAFPFMQKHLANPHAGNWTWLQLPFASGITVNEITTQATRIEQLQSKYNCQIETMEGAAFHYVCLQQNISFIQCRAVSNFVGERNKDRWKLKEAIANLNGTLINIITSKIVC
jgi:futalosine hydrolase